MFVYKGIHYVSWQPDEYAAEPIAAHSLDELAATGANWAGVLVTWYQADATASDIFPDPRRTPTDEALRYAIRELHNRGLKVMLKPHVDGADHAWRGEFEPADPTRWFASYRPFLLYCANLAAELGVEALCIGTEYKLLSGAAHRGHWCSLISDTRIRYGGLLTYAANASSVDDEFARTSFWDQLDFIGLDAYFPLAEIESATLEQLIGAWRCNASGVDLVDTISKLSARYNKPVVFTEIGYRSVAGANRYPWNYSVPGSYDPAQQANCYEAFFQVWQDESSWMEGAFWWNWPVVTGSCSPTEYTPRGKPASQVLRRWF